MIKHLIPNSWKQKRNDALLKRQTRHVFGPKMIKLDQDEAAVTCLVRNGAYYIDQFIAHYTALGVKHIVFLDNGSDDGTVELVRRHSNVSIYETSADASNFQRHLKRMIAETTLNGGWCLDVDIDEFFDYPHSHRVPLRVLLRYLNARGFTAMLTQMLDVFSDRPLSHLTSGEQLPLKDSYRLYDLSNVERIEYGSAPLVAEFAKHNRISHDATSLYFGGIRKTLYGLNCLLTKHSLFRMNAGLTLFPHVHFVNNALLADTSGVLLHYKLTSNAHDAASLNAAAFRHTSDGYHAFIARIESEPDCNLTSETTRELSCTNQLLDDAFLFASDSYKVFSQTCV